MSNSKTVGLSGLFLGLSAAILIATASDNAGAAICQELQTKHKNVASQEIVIGISPFSPGYEVADAQDPSKIVGLDPDMVQALTDCIGLKYKFQSMDFSGLVPALE